MNEVLGGKVIDVSLSGVTIKTDMPDGLALRKYEDVLVEFIDSRSITPDQRKKAWAIMGEIAEWSGDIKDDIYTTLRYEYTMRQVDSMKKEVFRLSKASITEARDYISFLIDFCLDNDVPTRLPLCDYSDDVERYVYSCALHKRCVICGKKADLHHATRVGMGRNRDKIDHRGMTVMPLCRQHHIECHTMSQEDFNNKYHIVGVPVDEEIVKKYKLGRTKK